MLSTGNDNIFIGDETGFNNMAGDSNTFVGTWAGKNGISGSFNALFGKQAGQVNSGSSNTFLGTEAGRFNETGFNNVFIGYRSGASETGSNKLYIANGPNNSDVLIYGDFSTGNVGIGTTTPIYPLEMGSGAHVTAGGVWTNASSRKYKENIQDLTTEEAITALEELKPTRFNYKVDKEDEYLGFIAEDVPGLVASKDRKGLSPMDIVAVLTKVLQEQQKMVQTQQAKIEELEARLNAGQ